MDANVDDIFVCGSTAVNLKFYNSALTIKDSDNIDVNKYRIKNTQVRASYVDHITLENSAAISGSKTACNGITVGPDVTAVAEAIKGKCMNTIIKSYRL